MKKKKIHVDIVLKIDLICQTWVWWIGVVSQSLLIGDTKIDI